MVAKRKVQGRDCVIHILKEESTATRGICFAQQLSDEERIEAFSYEWMSYPPSLFQPDTKIPGQYEMRKEQSLNSSRHLKKRQGVFHLVNYQIPHWIPCIS